MSAATLHRFVVTGFDYDAWRIVVEAASGAEAIAKAKGIYLTDGVGNSDASEFVFQLHRLESRIAVGGGPPMTPPRTSAAEPCLHGDCINIMRSLGAGSVDFILTDPPYVCRYKSRTGRTVHNNDNTAWLRPAFREMYRVLKSPCFCLTFYGWAKAEVFFDAWQAAGFRPVGHFVFPKRYASSSGFVKYQHEQAFLLAKGDVALPSKPPSDVIDWVYTGNRLHPTQKSSVMLQPLIEAFCKPGGLVLDPFCGSGSTLVAAATSDRDYLGIELDDRHCWTAELRLLS